MCKKLITDRGITWEYNMELLKAFIEVYGRAPKTKEIVNGVKLGQFWNKAKSDNKHKRLTADRKATVDYILNQML